MLKSHSSDFLQQVIPEVKSGGARNIVELAQAMRMPVETTRYKVKGMLKRGLAIRANVDYNKFGLTNYVAYLRLSSKAQANEKKFFQAISETSYLISYAKSIPDNGHVCSFALPIGASLPRLIRGLKEENLVESSRTEALSWRLWHMVRPDFFQLKRGIWKIDWSKVKKERVEQKGAPLRKPSTDFDDLDLFITRALEQKALIKLSEIAAQLKTTLNNVFYHFHKHVLEQKLIDDFIIRWEGTARQEAVLVRFEFEGLSVSEESFAISSVRKLPFLWYDALSLDTGLYVGVAMVPTSEYLQTLRYLSETVEDSSKKLRIVFLDPQSYNEFPLPAHLFKGREWKFDPDNCARLVADRLKK